MGLRDASASKNHPVSDFVLYLQEKTFLVDLEKSAPFVGSTDDLAGFSDA